VGNGKDRIGLDGLDMSYHIRDASFLTLHGVQLCSPQCETYNKPEEHPDDGSVFGQHHHHEGMCEHKL